MRLPPHEQVLILHEGRERFGVKRRPAYHFFFFGLGQVSDNYPRAADEEKRLLLTSSFIEPAKKASPKRVDEHLNPAYCESMVHTCVPQPCQDVLLLCFSHRACCLRSSSPQLRRRRRRRMRRPRNNQQIRTRLRAMNRCAQLRYSRLRDNRRQASPGSNRQPLPKLARVGKQRHGRSSETLALRTERLLASRRSAFWD